MLVALVVSAARPGGPAAASQNSTAGYGLWTLLRLTAAARGPTGAWSWSQTSPDRSLAAIQAKRTAASDLSHCATGAGIVRKGHLSKIATKVQKSATFHIGMSNPSKWGSAW